MPWKAANRTREDSGFRGSGLRMHKGRCPTSNNGWASGLVHVGVLRSVIQSGLYGLDREAGRMRVLAWQIGHAHKESGMIHKLYTDVHCDRAVAEVSK
jgi:hypothetical protein